MNKIIDVIKSYNDYSYDEILDTYSQFKTKDLLIYCEIKRNKLELRDIMKQQNKSYEDAFLFVFNIQRKLDGKYPVSSFTEMEDIIYNKITTNKIDEDDNEFFDF